MKHTEAELKTMQDAGVAHMAEAPGVPVMEDDWLSKDCKPQTDVKVCGLDEGCTTCQ